MANTAISGLTEITTLLNPDADFVEVVDTSLTANRKIKTRRFARWELAASWTFSVNVTSVDFTNLSEYSELQILCNSITLGTSGQIALVVSSDNGSTWKTTNGEYTYIASPTGTVLSNIAYIAPCSENHTTVPHSAIVSIVGWNLAQPKPTVTCRSDYIAWIINDAEACNALQVKPSNGGNITGGSIYIYGR